MNIKQNKNLNTVVISIITSLCVFIILFAIVVGVNFKGNLYHIPLYNLNKSQNVDNTSGFSKNTLKSVATVAAGNASGTGFFINKDGYLVTNNHVLSAGLNKADSKYIDSDNQNVQIIDNENNKYSIDKIIADPIYDIAVLHVLNHNNNNYLNFGNSDQLSVGDTVSAIGSPYLLGGTVTRGIISTLKRPMNTNSDQDPNHGSFLLTLQTDAAINSGNSGGPLLYNNQVIGVNYAIKSAGNGENGGNDGNIGIGFAIPSNQAAYIATSLIQNGVVKHAYFGASFNASDKNVSDAKGAQIINGDNTPAIVPGAPADTSGLKANDYIVEVDGNKVLNSQYFLAYIRSKQPGDILHIKYSRNNKVNATDVKLGAN